MAPVCNFPIDGTASFNNLLQVLRLSLHQKYQTLWTFGYLLFLVSISNINSAPFHHITYILLSSSKLSGGGGGLVIFPFRGIVTQWFMM